MSIREFLVEFYKTESRQEREEIMIFMFQQIDNTFKEINKREVV